MVKDGLIPGLPSRISEEGFKKDFVSVADLSEKKESVSGFGTKKAYKYPTIKLLLNEKREAALKEACRCAGIDVGRIDDHDQSAVWELIAWAVPLFRMRYALRELLGPALNESPDRESLR